MYLALSFLCDPAGFLGTDTGGKVAALEAQSVDVGYWAERWDPEGRVHPLWYIARVDDDWVSVTTLPMLIVAMPLYDLGGMRAALLLPMAGAVAAALAGRRLARLSGADDRTGWLVFWALGLASPLAVYALDFWEHTIGVALVLWAVVHLVTPNDTDAKVRFRPLAAGLLIGVAATMRTEALLYGAVATVVIGGGLAAARRIGPAMVTGAAVGLGTAIPLVANHILEREVLGTGLRSGRATGTALGAGSEAGSRVWEAAVTTVGALPAHGAAALVLGAVTAAGVAAAVAWPTARRLAAVGVAATGAVLAGRFAAGLGFVPGMLVASPLAAAGLAAVRRPRPDDVGSLVAVVALAAMPLVWTFQYLGGAGPQWGGRYLLPSGALLAILGAAAVARSPSIAVRRGVPALAVAVTVFGVAWLAVRSSDMADAQRALDRIAAEEPGTVVISEVAHLAREGGAFHAGRRWLTAIDPDDLRTAIDVARRSGARRYLRVALHDGSPPEPGERIVRLVRDVSVVVTGHDIGEPSHRG